MKLANRAVNQAVIAGSAQRNGFPERQTLCRMTESFLASATRALPMPDRLAIASAQSFNSEAFLTRVMITTAASNSKAQFALAMHSPVW
jgi:hypothetical protein